MFDVSFSELLLILIVGLLVFGPEKLPQVVRTVSLWLGRARRTFNQVRAEIEREVGVDELKRDLHNQSIMDTFKDVQNDLRQTQQELGHLPYEVSDVVRRNLEPGQPSQASSVSDGPPHPAAPNAASLAPAEHAADAQRQPPNT